MTETQAQDQLNILYDGDTNTPDPTDEDYLARRGLLNAAINVWELYGNTLWNELYKRLSTATSGTKTTTDGTARYAAPSNFAFVNGFVRVIDGDGNSTFYKQIQPYESHVYANRAADANYFYIDGDAGAGYFVNLMPTPNTTGNTIEYEYYANGTPLTTTLSKFEMNDPYFAIYYALSRMYQIDGESGKANEALSLAEGKLTTMKKRNGTLGYYQRNQIFDRDFETGVSGFGM